MPRVLRLTPAHGPGGEGFLKLVEGADRGVLVGATSAGPAGGELLYGLNVAVHAEVPVERLRHMIHTYPTIHRRWNRPWRLCADRGDPH